MFRGEKEIERTSLVSLMSNSERVLSREEIVENVCNNYFDTGTHYIGIYIAYLYKKLDKDFKKDIYHECGLF